jgi:glutathione synthase/RimK-type ligase-like ATP-grasp enzyme
VIDALWPECLDIKRRGDFMGLFQEIKSSNIPSLAGSWASVLAVSFKDRTVATLGGLPTPVPHAQTRMLPPDPTIPELRALRLDLGGGDLWVKPSSSTHGQGVTFIPASASDDPDTLILDTVRRYQGEDDLLIQEDVRSIVRDESRKLYRADLAITVLDRSALQVTARIQADPAKPTNSAYGGHPINIPPEHTPRPLADLAVQAIAATGNRYGSVDIFGGCFDWPGITVLETRPPVIGEINLQPGGRSPGFREQVLPALVDAYLHAIESRSG